MIHLIEAKAAELEKKIREKEATLVKLIENMGLWEIENIEVRYLSDDWVQFRCEKKVCNGPVEIRNVRHTWFDRLMGVSFDEKVETELRAFIATMKQRNTSILQLRKKEESMLKVVREEAVQVNGWKAAELIKKYATCQECGSAVVGKGEGSIEIDGDTFKRSCKCGWSIVVKEK